MKKENNIRKAGISLGGLIAIVFVCFVVVSFQSSENIVDNIVVNKVNQKVLEFPSVGEASLVDGATKVLYVMHYPHQAVPGTAYASNLSNGTAYEFYDYLDNEMTNETPYSTTFDVAILVGINVTHGYNTTSAAWEDTLFNATLNGITGYNFTGDVDLVEYEIGNSSTWTFYHFVLQDADGGLGNGFQIGQGVGTNATFELWAFQ